MTYLGWIRGKKRREFQRKERRERGGSAVLAGGERKGKDIKGEISVIICWRGPLCHRRGKFKKKDQRMGGVFFCGGCSFFSPLGKHEAALGKRKKRRKS